MLAEIFRLRLEATARAAKERSFYMRMRPTYGAAIVFAATLAATVGSPGPAEAFFFLPIFQQSQSSFSSNLARTRATIIARGAATGRGTRPTSRSSRPPGRARSATRRSRAPPPRARAESRRRNPRPVRRRLRAPAAFVRSRLRARAAAAPTPRCAGKAPRAEAVRRPPRRRPSPATPARTPPRRRPVPPAPAAPSAIPSTRSSARCSRRGLTSSSSSRTSRVRPKHRLRARATRKRSPELARMRRAAMSVTSDVGDTCRSRRLGMMLGR